MSVIGASLTNQGLLSSYLSWKPWQKPYNLGAISRLASNLKDTTPYMYVLNTYAGLTRSSRGHKGRSVLNVSLALQGAGLARA